jgi:hypothetical protein
MSSPLYQNMKQRIIVWLLRRLPTCQEATRLMSDSLDQKLSLRQRLQMKLHVLVCMWCERYRRQLLFLRQAMQQSSKYAERGIAPPPSLPPEARERLNRALSGKDS